MSGQSALEQKGQTAGRKALERQVLAKTENQQPDDEG